MTTTLKHLLAAMGAAIAWVASMPHAVWLLFLIQLVDIVSGIIVAYNTKRLCSEVGWKGITKKILMWLIVSMAYAVQHCSHIDIDLGDMAAFYYAVMEGLSVIENAGALGLPVPASLKRGLKSLSDDTGKEGSDG